jgi:PAS domain S-box-containing protein
LRKPPSDLTARHLAQVVESSDDAIVSKDLSSIITSWNPAAERIFGYTAEEAVGRSIRMLIPAHLQDEEDVVMSKIRAGEKVDHYETVRQRKDGGRISVSLTVSPIRDEDGVIVGASKIARDVTERARLQTEAEEANRLKDEFLAVLSHELRTPLNAILGYARLLRGHLLPADQVERAIETLERNARWLTQIVDDVLDVSRIVSGKIRLDVQAVDLASVVNNAVATVQPAADAKGVDVRALIDPVAGPVSGDPDRLQQVIWNLLSNAVKFTPRGGKVQIRLERVNSHIELVVSDNGIGIDAGFLPLVFERFRQADAGPTRKSGGLGLGLAIVRHIVEMHGGTVQAFSPGLNQGCSFTVSLPVMIVKPSVAAPKREHPAAETRAPLETLGDLHGIHVLAIDDERDALRLLRDVLEVAGATVTTCSSATAALSSLETERPHAILADVGMPEMDGHELIRRVRANPSPEVREIPAAALTAFARSEDRIKALQSGFEMHLSKPIDPAELVAAVGTLVRRFRSAK